MLADSSEPRHGKGRDCARTEEVLESYRRRAIRAEAEVERLKHGVLRDDEPTRCTAGHVRMMNEEWEAERALADRLATALQRFDWDHPSLVAWREARRED